MRTFYLVFIICFFGFNFGIKCQNSFPCATCLDQTPNSVTLTDPLRQADMSNCELPNYPRCIYPYQKNRFKWHENTPANQGGFWNYKIRKDLYPGSVNYEVDPINSPFVSAANSGYSYLQYLLDGDLKPDNLPADGWELVKQDFGFANYNNTNALVTISPLHISHLNKS